MAWIGMAGGMRQDNGMATLEDVARRAGVAASTVSRVLNQTRVVSAETRRRVLEAASELRYSPNGLARSLARSSTDVVGLVMSSTRNRFFADIVNAIEKECYRLGMMVLLANTNDQPEREADVIAALRQRRVDGILITPTCNGDSPGLRRLLESGVPAVMVDRLPEADLDGVGVENCRSMARIVAHLAALGHRRIGLLSGQREFTTTQERRQGYLDGLVAAGLTPDEELTSTGNADLAAARSEATRIMRERDVTAFIGGNNLTTIGIMLAARDLGRDVPRDLAVAGFDDFDWAEAFQPRLTVMAQPCLEIGRIAATLLRRRLANPSAPRRIVRLEPQLLVRESCGERLPHHR